MNRIKKAFTLIELLVVIAIIAILAAILFPVFAQAKTAAQKTVALSNAKQIALATEMYSNDSDDMLIKSYFGFPPAGGTWPTIYYDWRYALDPYLAKSKGLLNDPTNTYKEENFWTESYLDQKVAANTIYRANTFGVNGDVIGFANGDNNSKQWTPTALGSKSEVNEPADTVMLVPSRSRYRDLRPRYGSKVQEPATPTTWCMIPKGGTKGTCPTAGQGAIHTVGKVSTFVWVDGHAKAMPFAATIASKDRWQSDRTRAQLDQILKELYDEYK